MKRHEKEWSHHLIKNDQCIENKAKVFLIITMLEVALNIRENYNAKIQSNADYDYLPLLLLLLAVLVSGFWCK